MLKRSIRYICSLLLVLFLSVGCGSQTALVEKSIPVSTITVSDEVFEESLDYIGLVTDASITKYSFKTSATLGAIQVSKGQFVKVGDVLAILDDSDLALQVSAAQYQMEAAYATYQKAASGAQSEDLQVAEINVNVSKAAYDLALRNYESIKILYEAGGVSDIELAQYKLQLEQAQGNYSQAQALLAKAQVGRPEDVSAAQAQYDMARINYNGYQKQLADLTMVATQAGYVSDILYKEGELVPGGYPVVLVRSEAQIVEVGVSQKDIKKITPDLKVSVRIEEETYLGTITNIGQLPDEYARTFPVEITLADTQKNLFLGATASVSFITGTHQGILLPIPYITKDTQDYVYIVQEGRAYRRPIQIEGIYQDRAYVSGLESGDQVITSGVKGLTNGCAVIGQEG